MIIAQTSSQSIPRQTHLASRRSHAKDHYGVEQEGGHGEEDVVGGVKHVRVLKEDHVFHLSKREAKSRYSSRINSTPWLESTKEKSSRSVEI